MLAMQRNTIPLVAAAVCFAFWITSVFSASIPKELQQASVSILWHYDRLCNDLHRAVLDWQSIGGVNRCSSDRIAMNWKLRTRTVKAVSRFWTSSFNILIIPLDPRERSVLFVVYATHSESENFSRGSQSWAPKLRISGKELYTKLDQKYQKATEF